MFPALNATIVTGRAGWPELAELASKAGFAGVDIQSKALEAGPAATRELLDRLKLKPAVMPFTAEFRKDEATFQAGLKELEAMAKLGAAIGCARMATWILPSSDLPFAEQRALYVKRMKTAARILADSGVRLGLEFVSPIHLRKRMPQPFIYDLKGMAALAADCGPNVGLLLDCWHWHHAQNTVQDIVQVGAKMIVHVHVNDAARKDPEQVLDNDRLMPGEGVIDLAGFFGALQKIQYPDAVSVEVFGRGLKDMTPAAAVQLASDTTRAVMRRAGVL